jgi:hypothetical protein
MPVADWCKITSDEQLPRKDAEDTSSVVRLSFLGHAPGANHTINAEAAKDAKEDVGVG